MYPKPSVLPQVGFEKTRPNKQRAVLIWQERVHVSSFIILIFLGLDVRRQLCLGSVLPSVSRVPRSLVLVVSLGQTGQQVPRSAHHAPELPEGH